SGHDHAVPIAQGEHGGAVRHRGDGVVLGATIGGAGQERRRGQTEQLAETHVRVVEEGAVPDLIRHGQSSPLGLPRFFRRSPAVAGSAKSWRTWASVPRSGSSMKIFLSGPSLRSKITESHDADTTSSEYFCRHIPRKYARVSLGGS